jgi:hypothetical protein
VISFSFFFPGLLGLALCLPLGLECILLPSCKWLSQPFYSWRILARILPRLGTGEGYTGKKGYKLVSVRQNRCMNRVQVASVVPRVSRRVRVVAARSFTSTPSHSSSVAVHRRPLLLSDQSRQLLPLHFKHSSPRSSHSFHLQCASIRFRGGMGCQPTQALQSFCFWVFRRVSVRNFSSLSALCQILVAILGRQRRSIAQH